MYSECDANDDEEEGEVNRKTIKDSIKMEKTINQSNLEADDSLDREHTIVKEEATEGGDDLQE